MKLPAFFKRHLAPLTAVVLLISGCGGTNESFDFSSNSTPGTQAPISRDGKRGFSDNPGVLSGMPNLPVDTSNGPLLAIYMVGSDLESGGSNASKDLKELITGLRTLSAGQTQSLDIMIAFGGANKNGWRGMKWMTMEQLLADAEDGIFGNARQANSYTYRADGANMGHPSSLTQFLSFLTEHYPSKDRRFVVMWDHGASYGGFGNDENYNFRGLTLAEIDSSYAASGLPKLDLLGFDACLMASMETVRYVRDHATLLVASEELEPAHGWDYRYVAPALVNSPNMEIFGRGLVENFIDSANHPAPADDGKTLSLLALDQAGPALDALQGYAESYAAFLQDKSRLKVLSQSLSESARYGQEGRSYTSVDLLDFAAQTASRAGDAVPAQDLQAQLASLILYSRDDGSRPGSNGVAIAPPDKNAKGLTAGQLANEGWFSLVRVALGFVSRDTRAPVVVSREASGDGSVITYTDETPTEGRAFYGSRQANGTYVQIGEVPEQSTGVDDKFFIPRWDGQWMSVRDSSGASYTVPTVYADEDENGRHYYSLVDYRKARPENSEAEEFDSAVLEITVGSDGNIDSIVRPFFLQYRSEEDTDPEVVFERDAAPLAVGDSLQLYASSLQEGGQQEEGLVPFGSPFTLRSTPTVEFSQAVDPAAGQLVSGAVGEDFAENVVLTIDE